MRFLVAILAITLGLITFAPQGVLASSVDIYGDDSTGSDNGIGSFTGSMTYTAIDEMNATLEVELTNTTALGNGGFITAFVFNVESDQVDGISLDKSGWSLLGEDQDFQDAVKASPYGYFDVGAALANKNPDFLGGGSPNTGIAGGETETFLFELTGTDLLDLNIFSFVDEMSYKKQGKGFQLAVDGEFMIVRLKGLDICGGSDKMVAQVVPIPPSLLLLFSGICGLIGYRKFSKFK
jgi:hypothetical protein